MTMLEKLRLRQFCCCCTLRTGSLVIGTTGWLFTLMHAMAIESSMGSPAEDELEIETRGNGMSIGLSILSFALCISLVIGVYKENRKFILPWLIAKFLEVVILIIVLFICFFALFVTTAPGWFFLLLCIILLITGIVTYCWLCVWSLYQDLGESMMTITPINQEIHMVEQIPYDNNAYNTMNIKSPPQEMV